MLGAALTTAHTFALTSASAATRSRSTWSMMAMSPGRRRLVSRLVRRSILAGPATPGGRSPPRGRRNVASLITAESARRPPSGPTAAPPSGAAQASVRLVCRCDREQLLGVAATECGLRQPGEHAGELLEPIGTRDVDHRCRRTAPILRLADDKVMVGERSDLRQMGDDDDLRGARERGKASADLDRGLAAYTGVDLVEYEGRYRVAARQHHLEREHQPRQLAPRSPPVERSRCGAGIGDQHELDLIDAGRAEGQPAPVAR